MLGINHRRLQTKPNVHLRFLLMQLLMQQKKKGISKEDKGA